MDVKHTITKLDQEYFTDEKCYIIELLNDPLSRDFSIARARVEPGVSTEFHKLKLTSECYYILSGKGVAEVGTKRFDMEAHNILRIPADAPQRITNTGNEDLIFLCFCVPAFSVENYINC